MNKYFWLIVISSCLVGVNIKAQVKTPLSVKNRFIPFSLGENVNTIYDEVNPVLSPDEQTLFFSRVDYPQNYYGYYRTQDIWYSEKQPDGSWGEAKRVNARFNENRYNALYSIADNGDCLISGIYTNKGRYKKRGLSIVRFDTVIGKWGNPVKVKVPGVSRKDKGLTSSAYMNKKGNVIVLSYTKRWQSERIKKIRFSVKDSKGKWKSPKASKNSIMNNLFKSMESPYLEEDDSTLYFSAFVFGSSNRARNDIYVSHRLDNTWKRWKDPVKASEVVNTNDWESYYKQFSDNNWAYYCKASFGDDSDIYMVKLNEPRPYVDLHGTVMLEGKPMRGPFSVMINGSTIDSVRINRDSSSYAVRLPFGRKYEIQAYAEEREAKIEIIDAVDQIEYSNEKRDLQLSNLPFLDLSGVVTVNGEILTDPFTVLINGFEVDSVITNPSLGRYSVKLPLGNRYALEVRSGSYIPVEDYVDVVTETKQLRAEKNLIMRAIPYVDISGRLLSTETNAPIFQSANPKVMVNGIVIDSIATLMGEYKIRLNWGQKYVLQVQADEYAPIAAVVDLINVKNYSRITQNIYANPLKKYATVTGKVLNMKNGLPVNTDYFIEVNGARSTNSTVNKLLGTYEVKINLGEKTTLTANADKFFSISEIIDLTSETENVKVLKDLQMMPLEVGEKILLNHIAFETASTNLKKESFADLDRVVDLLRAVPTLKIEISGHTDSSGKDAYNLSLSNSRAKSVSDYILSQGITMDRVEHKGYGEANPVANNLTPEGRAKNRRVEFIVLEQ